MSGGYFGYVDEHLMNDIFGYSRYRINGKGYNNAVKDAIKNNPLEDKQISELVFDVMCILHSFDWYKECDTSEEEYLKDVKEFKDKWFGSTKEERVANYLDACKTELEEYANNLLDGLKRVE